MYLWMTLGVFVINQTLERWKFVTNQSLKTFSNQIHNLLVVAISILRYPVLLPKLKQQQQQPHLPGGQKRNLLESNKEVFMGYEHFLYCLYFVLGGSYISVYNFQSSTY